MVKSTIVSLFFLLIYVNTSWAGPPFRTDDPEPVDYKHGEFYIATQYEKDKDVTYGTAPHIELNYGVVPNVMVHLIAPYAFNEPEGVSTKRGYGDTEVGIKYRFVNCEDEHFMVGTFPLVELPTGDSDQGLGAGHTTYFVPFWIQKSWEPWESSWRRRLLAKPRCREQRLLVFWLGTATRNNHNADTWCRIVQPNQDNGRWNNSNGVHSGSNC